MSVNACSSNDSLFHPSLSSINYFLPFGLNCITTTPSSSIYTAFFIINILLLLSVSILILHKGVRQWRCRSTSTAAISHTDSFTYHLVTMELLSIVGCILCCCSIYIDNVMILWVGFSLWTLTWFGETLLHILTCVERYMAVVHPITYLGLRGERGIRIRNGSIGCLWLLCFGATGLLALDHVFASAVFWFVVVSLVIISFCSLAVLCVLIRPGPGEQGGDRERVDQSKKRAFHTIVAILGTLLLRFLWNLVWSVINWSRESSNCVMMVSGVWFNIPSSLVLPLLFLHRTGTLTWKTPTK